MQKVDMALIIATGFDLRARLLADDLITRDYDFYELLVPQILRGIGMMFRDGAGPITSHVGTLPGTVKNAFGLSI